MAAHLSIRRIPSVFPLALLGLAIAGGTASYISRSEPETAPVAQIAAAVPLVTPLAKTMPAELPRAAVAEAEVTIVPDVEDEIALEADVEDEIALEADVEDEIAFETDAEDEVALEPDIEAVIVVAVEPAVASVAAPVAPPTAAPVAPAGRVTVARLVVEPQVSPALRDPAVSILRAKNMAPIPKRAPRVATADTYTAPQNAATLFQSGTEIRVKKGASVFITARNIPDNDRLLEAYSAERPNGGRVQTRLGEAAAVPGLLGIAAQAHRTQSNSQGAPAYSLADAMRDAIWRKNTAARLKSLTIALNPCAEGVGGIAKNAPSIGLSVRC